MKRQGWFNRFAATASRQTGRPLAFGLACFLIFVWIATGPILHFSELWQLTINTGTTIVTFLMVFLLQSTQNRDSKALQVKLDELIRVTRQANDALLDLEELSEEDIDLFRKYYERLAERARQLGLPSPDEIEEQHQVKVGDEAARDKPPPAGPKA